MRLVGLLWLLVRHQINSVKNKMLMEVVKSAQSTSSCFYFNSYLGWPKSLIVRALNGLAEVCLSCQWTPMTWTTQDNC